MDNARIHHHEDITALVESYGIVTFQSSSLFELGSSFIYQVAASNIYHLTPPITIQLSQRSL